MRRLTLPEYATRSYEPASIAVASALGRSGAVRVTADLSGRLLLAASSSVGVVTAGEIELRITPKLGIRRLLWLIGYAQDPRGWSNEDAVQLADADDVVSALAVSFLAATNRGLAAGILQGYRVTEEALPLLCGRLREGDQLRRRLGLAVPLELRYDEYTVDIAENQVLLAAARRLLRVPGLPQATHRGLRRLVALLGDVSPLVQGAPPPTTQENRLTRRYQPALRLARLALAGRSFEQPFGPVTASGFLFDLNKVFEDWLTAALRSDLLRYGGVLRPQHRMHLDVARRIDMRPDMVWEAADRPVAVIDAKYKLLRGDDHPQDLYQMLAYCTALGLPVGHLIYAGGGSMPARHVVQRSGASIRVWSVDLSVPVPELLNRVDLIAKEIATEADSSGGS